MKTFLIFFALLAWLTSFASAQTLVPGVDPAVQQVITEALPAKYASYGSAIVLAAMILGRLLKALADGRGIKGWLSAIWLGTNSSAKILIAALCLLSLPACSNPADTQRAVAIGKIGLDLLVRRGVLTEQDAADARQAGQILITPAAAPAKQPVDVQP